MKIGRWLAYCALGCIAVVALSGSLRIAGQKDQSRDSNQLTAKQTVPQNTERRSQGLPDSVDKARLVENFAKAPMSFEENQGQSDGRVKFLSRGLGYTLFLTSNEAILALQNPASGAVTPKPEAEQRTEMRDPLGLGVLDRQPTSSSRRTPAARHEGVLRMQLVGANSSPRISGLEESEAKSNYFIGNDPKKWHSNVANFAKVQYAAVYPGVDIVFYGQQRELEYDFVVAPGADPSVITLSFAGDGKSKDPSLTITINDSGELVAHLPDGEVRFHKPIAYQRARTGQENQPVDGRYVLRADGKVGFELGSYDRRRQLVIDPVISFSSYLGGSNQDLAVGVAVDRYEDVEIVGNTRSADFPLFDQIETYHGGTCGGLPCRDIFVSKFSPTGSKLQYSTYIGGSNDDVANDVVLDMAGDTFVVGSTLSTDFPITPHAFQKTFGGGTVTGDAFVFELASKGGFEYSSYLGGSGDDQAYGITVDYTPTATPNVYVVGSTTSTNFPTTTGAYQRTCGKTQQGTCSNGFAAKVNPKGTALVYSSYLGGSNGLGDAAYGVAVDSNNDVYIAGITGSPNFPTTSGAYDRTCGSDGLCNGTYDGFVSELNGTATELLFSTFLGGSSYDYVGGIALDSSDAIYVSGNTTSSDFPTTSGAGQTTFGGMSAGCSPTSGAICGDATVTKFSPGGATLAYSTYLGGSGDEYPGMSMALDSAGNAYITGQTSSSTDFPLVNPFQATYGGGSSDAFVTMVSSTGTFTYSTYLGGNGQDFGYRTVLDPTGNLYLAGGTVSTNFPVKAGEFQTGCGTDGTCNGGLMDAWVAKVISSADLAVSMTVPSTVTSGSNLTYTLGVRNNGPDTAVAITATDAVPTGTTFFSVATSAGSCTAPPKGSTGTVTCTVSSLPSNGRFTITMVVNVNAASGSVISNTISATSTTFDSKKGNNSGTKKTTVN